MFFSKKWKSACSGASLNANILGLIPISSKFSHRFPAHDHSIFEKKNVKHCQPLYIKGFSVSKVVFYIKKNNKSIIYIPATQWSFAK